MKNKVKITAVIACAGTGKRSKLQKNKIFFNLKGVPVIYKTVYAFSCVKRIDEIVIVHSEGEDKEIKQINVFIDET